MKKFRSSFFIKIVLIMLPLVLVVEAVMLVLSYNITYDSNLKNAEKQIRNAVDAAIQYSDFYNLYKDGEKLQEDGNYDWLCDMFDVTYVFAVKADIETRDETYLAIGFGDDASQEAKDTRYPGVKVEGTLNDEEIEAYNGNTDGVILHEKTRFGDTLVCYEPLTQYFDSSSMSYKKYEKPVIVGAEISLDKVNKSFMGRFNRIALLTVLITVFLLLIFAAILYFRITKPIRQISLRMSSFITDREKGIEKLPVKGKDELALMASSFNTMTDEIDRYINDIDALTREKHTQEAELNIARNIQMGLLRPARTETEAADIRAYMLPAKDVGGDLYEYRILGDGRIFTAIADVAGKGISAALFMAHSVTLLSQYAQLGHTPAQILTEFNDTLASQNPGGLFITTFIAIWDPYTGKLFYSNAGHNFPYLMSDTLVRLEGAHGVAAGLFEGEEYEDAVIELKDGDILFLYTDGVNEAKNTGGGFYSTERLEDKLTACIGSGSTETIDDILNDLNGFTDGAEQNDDITMLTLRIKPRKAETVLHLSSELPQLALIREAIQKQDIGDDLKRKLYLAAEEMFVNICSYAYDSAGDVEVRLALGDRVELSFTDSGKPFDPTAELLDIDEYDHDNSVGGLGRFITFSIADGYDYEYRDGKNILTIFFERGD